MLRADERLQFSFYLTTTYLYSFIVITKDWSVLRFPSFATIW